MTAAVTNRAVAGPALIPVDIGHAVYAAVTDPDTAFWALATASPFSYLSLNLFLDQHFQPLTFNH
jgi:hypothetical protein